MDIATKTALENDARKYREASAKLALHAERIETLLKSEKEIASLLPSENETLPLPLGAKTNGVHETPQREMIRFRRVMGSMTQPQACATALEATKVPMTTAEIAATVQDLGLPVKLPKVPSQLGAVLSRHRDKFKTVGKGKWVLTADTI